MSLTTPVMTQDDASFPAENWFLYWKAAPSLWGQKMRLFTRQQEIFVPIFWSLHSPSPNVYDFGQFQPETDLAKLELAAKEAGKKLFFIIQLGPFPFLPNGGIPSYLAGAFCKDENGLIQATLDRDEQVYKMYSFYEQKVFLGFRKFLSAIASYWQQNNLRFKIFLGQSFYAYKNGQGFLGYFDDYSEGFENAFQRFIQQRDANSIASKVEAEQEFKQLMLDLYSQTAVDLIGENFGGEIKFSFLGTGNTEICLRAFSKGALVNTPKNINYIKQSIKWGMVPSSILLMEGEREEALNFYLQSQWTPAHYQQTLEPDFFDGDTAGVRPLIIAKLFANHVMRTYWFQQLEGVINNYSPAGYRLYLKWHEKDLLDEEQFPREILFIFDPEELPKDGKGIIKYFLKGGRVILDRDVLPLSILNKISLFTDENKIEVEEVEYIGKISFFRLGEGRCLLFSSKELEGRSEQDQSEFWSRVLNVMGLETLTVEQEEGIESNWTYRHSNPYELSFQEVRRFNLFNTTSYKKRVKIHLNRNYALIKVLDSVRAEMSHQKDIIEIQFAPKGKISFDFGIVGEVR